VPAVEPEPAPEPAAVVPEFYFVPEFDPVEVDEKDLHDQIKLWRHGRATRTLWQVIQDGYVAVFSVIVLGAMLGNVLVQAQSGAAACTTDECSLARLMMPTAMVLASFTLTLAVARLFGPILASAAEGFWLMDAPLRRRRLLRGRLVLPVVIAGVLAALLTALVAALSGMDVVSVALWTAAAGIGSAALMALAGAEQGVERTTGVRSVLWLFGVATLVVLLAVVSIAAGWIPAVLGSSVEVARWVVAGLLATAVVGLVIWLGLAMRRLEQIRRARLLSGGSLVAGMQGAMFALDFGLIRDILVEREAAARGHVRPVRGRGLGIWALVWRDLQRLGRFPKPWIGLAVSLVVPYAADALRLSQLNPLVSGLGLFIALVPFLGSLRVLTRTGGMARSLPFKTSTIRTAAMAVPAGLALLWTALVTPAFIGIAQSGADRVFIEGLLAAGVTGIAGLFGAVRWVTAKRPDFGVPMMATPGGAMPPTLMFNLFRGIDVVAAVTAPLILGAPATWSLGIAGLIFVLLRGTFNM
ncbi:MAG: ABC transporter permease, partial [Propionibacteriaceae bacterium]|nr:ABC transporter permease [Propionibacteriaceae bacterium]